MKWKNERLKPNNMSKTPLVARLVLNGIVFVKNLSTKITQTALRKFVEHDHARKDQQQKYFLESDQQL